MRGKRIKIQLKAGHHRPASETPRHLWRLAGGKRHAIYGVSLADRWWPDIECWLGSFVIFQGIRTSIAKKHITLWFFRGWRSPLDLRSWLHNSLDCFFFWTAPGWQSAFCQVTFATSHWFCHVTSRDNWGKYAWSLLFISGRLSMSNLAEEDLDYVGRPIMSAQD